MGSLRHKLDRPLHGLGVNWEGGEAVGLGQGGLQDLHGEALDDVGLVHPLPVDDVDPGEGFPVQFLHLQRSDPSQNLLSWFLWRLGSKILDCFNGLGSNGSAA